MMKKLFFSVLLLLMMAIGAVAQVTVTIGEGTSYQSYPLPGYYGWNYNVFLYTPTAAAALGADCDISSIAFNVSSNNTSTGAKLSIWVKDVAADYALAMATTFGEYTTGATLVYESNDLSTTAGWNTFDFISDFSHEGGNALLVAVRGEGCSTSGGCSRSCYYTTATNTYWSKNQDYSDPGTDVSGSLSGNRANIQLGLTYTGAVCLSPSGLNATAITHNSATLSWSENGNATAWVLQYGTDNTFASGTYTEASVNNPTTNLTGLNALTTYYVRVKPDCDTDGSHWSSSISFTTTAVATEVGDSWSDNFEGATCAWELINGTCTNAWAWGTAANNGGTHALYVSNDNGLTNEYSDGGTMVYATKLLSFATGKYEFSYDWKANGESTWDFLRVALVPASVTLSAGTSLPTGLSSNAVPTGWIALDGGSKLNLVTEWQNKELAVNVTAGNYYFVFAWRNDGGTNSQPPAAIDNVSITRIACAYDVTNLAVSNISTTAANLTWTAGEASQWQVAYSTSSDFAGATEQIVNTASFNMTSLTSASTYYVKVRAYCGGTDFGAWSSVLEFNTACDAITSYPWNENFDGYTLASTYTPSSRTLPICWNYINECTYNDYKYYPTIYYYSYTDHSHSTPNSLRLYSYYSSWTDYDPQPQYAILPAMENLSTKRIELWAKGYNTSSTFKIGLMTDPSDASTFVQVGEEHALTTSYQKFTVDLTGTGNYIAIMIDAASTSRNYNGMYIDDITVLEQPSCLEPTALSTSNVLASEATLSWTAGASETAWQICLNDNEGNLIDVNTNSYTLTGLTPETAYNVKVRAKCSESDFSEWTSNISFTTTVACPVPTAFTYSNISNTSATVSWTAGASEGVWNLKYKKTADDEWTEVNGLTSSSYTLTSLTSATAYSVQVQADCELDGTSTWLSGSFTTAYGIPFVEEFGTSSIPANWIQRQGLLSEVLGGTALTSGTAWYFGSNNGVFDSHARINIYGDSRKYWLLTPTIVMDANVELRFDLALTAYSGNGAASGTCEDDKFVVLISTDNAATWTILRQYDNAEGSEYVYNDIPTAGEEVAIDLTSYSTDNVIIAFYGESTVNGNGDNNLHIDNVSLDYIRSCTKPTDLVKSNVTARTVDLSWTNGADETAWQICLDDDETNIVDADSNPFTLTGLTPETAYRVKVRANCGGDVSAWTSNVSFTTLISCPVPTALAATLTPGDGSVATLTWTENGTATAWTLEYGTAADFAGATSVYVNGTPSTDLTGLTAETPYYARVKTVCGVDDESVWSSVINFTPTDAYSITLNDGTATNSYVPVYGNWVDQSSRSQFVIPASDLTALQGARITKLTYYSSTTSTNWGAAEFDVRLAEVENTAIESLATWDDMTLAYHGSLGISGNVMEVTFDTPYTYMGGNLMIGTNETVSGTYVSCSWYGVTATGASMGGYNTSISQRNFLPKVTINYLPPVPTYTITATAGENGTITPAGAVPVDEGAEQAFTITPAAGYQIASVMVDTDNDVTATVVANNGVYTFTNVTADHTIVATFEAIPATTYTITATAGENGTITPAGAVTVDEGDEQAFTITPAAGYRIASVMVDTDNDVTATVVANNGVYTFTNVTADHTIVATFEVIPATTYTITATAGENGTITPAGAVTVDEGDEQAFTITPAAGYQIASVMVDTDNDVTATVVANNGVYTFTNVTADHTIAATFEVIPANTYTITVEVEGAYGAEIITYNGEVVNAPVVVEEGATPSFVIDGRMTTNGDFSNIESITVDGEEVYLPEIYPLISYTYTFEPVMANHTLVVTFVFVSSADLLDDSSMAIYPNPNNGMFSIDFSNIEGDATYEIIDVRGAVVETRSINVMNGATMNFSHNLDAGTYFVRIINGDKVYVEQIVVE